MSAATDTVKMNSTEYPDGHGGITTVGTRHPIQDDQDLLVQLNNEEIGRLVPLIVYLSMIFLIGIPGNSVVFHVYRTLYKRSNSRYFILCLSAIDLFTCMFVVPFELFTVVNQYTYTAVIACKLARFCNSAPTVASGFMFLLIAIDRFRKVCQPFGWQIKPRMAKLLCIGMVLCGVLFSWPAFIIYGKKTFLVSHLSLNATECSTDDAIKGTVYPFIYNSIFGFLFIVGTTSLVSLYAIIGRAISKHAKDLVHFQSSVEMKTLRNDSQDSDPDLSNTMGDSERSWNANNGRSLKRNIEHRATTSSSIGDRSDVFDDDNGEDVLASPIGGRCDVIDNENGKEDVPESNIDGRCDVIDNGNGEKNVPESNTDGRSDVIDNENGKEDVPKSNCKCDVIDDDNGERNVPESTIGGRCDVIEDANGEGGVPDSATTTLDRSTLTKKVPERIVSFETSMERNNIYRKSPKRSVSHDTACMKPNGANGNAGKGSLSFLRKLSSIGSRLTLASSSDNPSNGHKPSHNSVSHRKRQQRARKMSFIMFLITLAYILSYLPHISLMLIRGINKEFVESMSNDARGIYKFFLRSYYLNCVVNPFIYSVCDKRFRNGVRRLTRCS